MVPIVAVETLPYCVLNCAALSPTCWSMARRSLRSRRSRPLSSAILKTTASTPSWTSFSPSIRPRRSGPMSEMVARTGWPLSPIIDLRIGAARFGKAGEIAFHIGHEHRHADRGEALRERLQRDALAGAGGAGDEAVAIRERGKELERRATALGDEERRSHAV